MLPETAAVCELRIKARDVMAARELASGIESENGYKSVSWQEAHEDLLSPFQIHNIIPYMVVGAILLVASFGTYTIISTITHEKTRGIAILKSLGVRQVTVRRIFVLEALVIGVIGLVIGWALGLALTFALQQIEVKSPFTASNRLPVLYSFTHYALAGAVALLASLVAGYFPARKAASVQPVDIIRGAS